MENELRKKIVAAYLAAVNDCLDTILKEPKKRNEVKRTKEIKVIKIKTDKYRFIQSIADRMHWNVEKTEGYLKVLFKMNPSALFSVLLKEIAIDLDKQYPDHINNCSEVYVISTLNGKINKIPRHYIKNFRNFSAFRTLEDARTACIILSDLLKYMFNGEQKD